MLLSNAVMALSVLLFAHGVDGAPSVAALNYDAIYSDMDGTILDGSKGPREASLRALGRFMECGGRFGLASGRTIEQVRPHLKKLKPNLPLVLSNGAVVYSPDGGTLLWAEYMDSGLVREVVAKAGPLPSVQGVLVQEEQRIFADRGEKAFIKFVKQAGLSQTKVDKKLAAGFSGKAVKVMLIVKDREAGTKAAEALRPLLAGRANVMVTSSRTVEVVSPETDKAVAIAKVLKQEKLAQERVVVFGDGENDTRMVGEIGLGVAMENCRASTCDAADLIIGSNHSDAIGKFIEALILAPSCGSRR